MPPNLDGQPVSPRLYDGKNCPCPSDCVRRGKCAECIRFHHARGDQTYCEYLSARSEATPETPDSAAIGGRKLRLLDYGPCAG